MNAAKWSVQPVADLRAGALALASHADPACRRLAARLARILAGDDAKQALGLSVTRHGSLIAAERVQRRNAELFRWRALKFAGTAEREAAREMARLWKAYPDSQQAKVDADLAEIPETYRGGHQEHLFALGKIGANPVAEAGIRKLFQRLGGDNYTLFCPQQVCESSMVIEPENGNAAHARLTQG